MKSVSGKKFYKILKNNDWELKRVNGSHHIFTKKGISARISVPIHGNKPLKIGLLKHLMKIAGINEVDL